jgi:hypothetical protein
MNKMTLAFYCMYVIKSKYATDKTKRSLDRTKDELNHDKGIVH